MYAHREKAEEEEAKKKIWQVSLDEIKGEQWAFVLYIRTHDDSAHFLAGSSFTKRGAMICRDFFLILGSWLIVASSQRLSTFIHHTSSLSRNQMTLIRAEKFLSNQRRAPNAQITYSGKKGKAASNTKSQGKEEEEISLESNKILRLI
jgi:hypothetical protein